MRTLCVAVILLTLISVCQSASLACDKLSKPLEKGPDLPGRWYYLAFATKQCLPSTVFNAVFWPSIVMDISSKGLPNLYDANLQLKMYGFCVNETEQFFNDHVKIWDVDSDNNPTGSPNVLLQTSCPDCIVVQSEDTIGTLVLLSKRNAITEAEMKEFETQAECLGWSKPKVLNTDFDVNNCRYVEDSTTEDESEAQNLLMKVYERVKSKRQNIIDCLVDSIVNYLPASLS
ncbi:uncharacterized protein ACNS7B_005593 [Menidia menidia]|uniref:(Atlantic silverside) hypothetical protein n=1 Tax=Menidia menidia TaxID=238744 RepID=A0A8S4BGT7_9TELE|nr:unnamed protein product [Menidia menidia]